MPLAPHQPCLPRPNPAQASETRRNCRQAARTRAHTPTARWSVHPPRPAPGTAAPIPEQPQRVEGTPKHAPHLSTAARTTRIRGGACEKCEVCSLHLSATSPPIELCETTLVATACHAGHDLLPSASARDVIAGRCRVVVKLSNPNPRYLGARLPLHAAQLFPAVRAALQQLVYA